jgi:hypothetical protein
MSAIEKRNALRSDVVAGLGQRHRGMSGSANRNVLQTVRLAEHGHRVRQCVNTPQARLSPAAHLL